MSNMIEFGASVKAWYVINIKARQEQTSAHYVNAFKKLWEKDPLISINKSGRSMSLKFLELSKTGNVVSLVEIGLLAYTIIDKDGFYNIKKHEKVPMDNWNKDVVANISETELLFFPSFHKVVVKKSTAVSLNRILQYLQEALDIIEPEVFDVSVVTDRDAIERIIKAKSIYSIEAKVSYSNPGNTSGFRKLFEDKVKGTKPQKMSISLVGSVDNPLVSEDDGLIQCIADMAEQDGTINAVIQEGNKRVTIDSKEHPKIIHMKSRGRDWLNKLWTKMNESYGK